MSSNPFNRNYNQNIIPDNYNNQNQPNDLMGFIRKYANNPQLAQQEVQQLMNSGQINQQMINQYAPQVNQVMSMLGIK